MRLPAARRCRPIQWLAAAAVCAASGSARAAETYPISMGRPAKVGEQFDVTTKTEGEQTAKETVNGQAQPPRVDKYTADLIGVLRVEAINDVGQPTKVTLTVAKLVKAVVLATGTVVTADHSGERTTFKVNGSAVDDDRGAVLASVVDVARPGDKVTPQQMFGTPQRQPIGGTWAGNTDACAAELAAVGMPVTAEHVKVASTLTGLTTVDGQPAETVRSTLTADAIDPTRQLQGWAIIGGTFESTTTWTLPLDVSMAAEAVDVHYRSTFQGKGGGGGTAATLDTVQERTVHETATIKR